MVDWSPAKLSIAIADDDRSFRHLLKSLLQQLGHQVAVQVDNGQALVEACKATAVDLIILDLEMPILDGLEAAEQVGRFMQIPIILLSAHPDLHHLVVGTEPIAICMSKPVSGAQLNHAIETLVHREA